MIERKLIPGFEADHFVAADAELETALLSAEAAMGLDELVIGNAPNFESNHPAVSISDSDRRDGSTLQRAAAVLPRAPSLAFSWDRAMDFLLQGGHTACQCSAGPAIE